LAEGPRDREKVEIRDGLKKGERTKAITTKRRSQNKTRIRNKGRKR